MSTAAEEKILTASTLTAWREQQRAAGRRVVVTNGVFDLMHRGHAEYLQQAAALGGALLVLVNDDASVTALKGPSRPIQPEADRLYLLASLACVDAVCLFHGPRADEALRLAAPDVYVKGGDYTVQSLDKAEYAALQAVGAEVKILKLVPGCSTTSIVKRIMHTAVQFGDTGKAVTLDQRLSLIFGRRSIRRYRSGVVLKQTELASLLEAAMAAPSALACHPAEFVVVEDPARLEQLAQILPNGKFMTGASAVVVVCANPDDAAVQQLSYMIQDCSACIENMLLAAHAIGLGSCWLGIHPIAERIEKVSGFLHLPAGTLPLGAVVIGTPAEEKPPRTSYTADKVHMEQW